VLKYLKVEKGSTRFALVIGKKVDKKATVRNRIRRQIYEIIRLNYKNWEKPFWVVVLVHPNIFEKTYLELEEALVPLLNFK